MSWLYDVDVSFSLFKWGYFVVGGNDVVVSGIFCLDWMKFVRKENEIWVCCEILLVNYFFSFLIFFKIFFLSYLR